MTCRGEHVAVCTMEKANVAINRCSCTVLHPLDALHVSDTPPRTCPHVPVIETPWPRLNTGLVCTLQTSAPASTVAPQPQTRPQLHARRFCRLLREGRLDELAVCVIDELHMIRDAARGAALETSITKLLFSPSGRDVQVCLVLDKDLLFGSSSRQCEEPRMHYCIC